MVFLTLLQSFGAHLKNSKGAAVVPRGLVKIATEADKLPPLSFIQGKGAKAGFSQNLSVPLPNTFCEN